MNKHAIKFGDVCGKTDTLALYNEMQELYNNKIPAKERKTSIRKYTE